LQIVRAVIIGWELSCLEIGESELVAKRAD
jgi:hypothetical protein